MPGPSGLSSIDPSNEMEHHGKEKTYILMMVRLYTCMHTTKHCVIADNEISSDSSAIPRGINPTVHAMYESCYKAGFEQYHKWLVENLPDDAKEWYKKQQELKKQEEEQLKYISKFLVQSVPTVKCDPKPTQRVSGSRVFT